MKIKRILSSLIASAMIVTTVISAGAMADNFTFKVDPMGIGEEVIRTATKNGDYYEILSERGDYQNVMYGMEYDNWVYFTEECPGRPLLYKVNDNGKAEKICLINTVAKYEMVDGFGSNIQYVKVFEKIEDGWIYYESNDGGVIYKLRTKIDGSVIDEIVSSSDKKDTSEKTTSTATLPATQVKGVVSGNKIKLTWDKVEGADGYRVYLYNSETKKYTKVATVSGVQKTFKDLEKGAYKYKVVPITKTAKGYKNGEASKTCTVKVK